MKGMKKRENFSDCLLKEIERLKNPSCIGLDPKIEEIPSCIKRGNPPEKAILEFTKKVIDATYDIVPAFKLQMAHFERFKSKGIAVLEKIISYLKEKKKIIILDGKRNDIGATSQIYALTYLSKNGFDVQAITINPYLGTDGVMPFVEIAKKEKKGIFVLVKTSNPSSAEIQEKKLQDGKKVSELIASLVCRWGKETEGERGYNLVGAVVSATFPKSARNLRKLMPKSIFLVPGYGAQGGKAKDVVANFKKGLEGAIVNSSRGIIFAFKRAPFNKKFGEKRFDEAVRESALAMKRDLLSALKIKEN